MVKQIKEETKIKGNLYTPQGNKKNKLEIDLKIIFKIKKYDF